MSCDDDYDLWGFWLLLLNVICLWVCCGILAERNIKKDEHIKALEHYIIQHADKADIELIELLKNIDKVEK